MKNSELKTKLKSNQALYYIACFLFPAVVMCAIFAALHITPFGDKTLIFGDSNGYYINYLSYFRTILSGDHSLLYSFSKGCGGNIYGLSMGMYMLSPYMPLFLLAGWDYLAEVYSISCILMTSLSGLTMGILLGNIRGKKYENLIFVISYALMGFAVVNNYNFPYFATGPMMLPIVVLGIYRLMNDKSPLVYILSLAYSVAAHFQMGFVICTAALLIFVAKLFADENNNGKRKTLTLKFFVSSIIGGLMAAICWLPALLAMVGGRASETKISDYLFEDNDPLLSMAARMFSGASSASQLVDGYPAIFCGILVVALVILYFMDKHIDFRKKVAAGSILTIYILSFYIKTFTTIFQGFSVAAWFVYRQSFVFSFIMIMLAAEEFSHITEIEWKNVKRCGVILVIAFILIFAQQYEFISGANAVLDLGILGLMGFGLWFYKNYPNRADYKSLVLLIAVGVSFQMYFNYFSCMRNLFEGEWEEHFITVSELNTEISMKQPLIEGIKTANDDFFRMEDENPRSDSGNDAMFYDYNGVGHTSYERTFVTSALGKLGADWQSIKINKYGSGVPASMDAFLGLRYVLSKRDLTEEKGYEYLMSGLDGDMIYKNPYELGIAILSDSKITDVSMHEEGTEESKPADRKDVFALQNEIYKSMTGKDEDIYTREEELVFSIHNNTESVSMTSEELAELQYDFDEEDEEFSENEVEDEKNAAGNENENETGNVSENETEKVDGAQSNLTEKADASDEETAEKLKPYQSRIDFTFTAKKDGPIYFYDSSAVTDEVGSSEDVLQYIGTFKSGDEVTGSIYYAYDITKEILKVTADGLYVYYADNSVLAEYAKILQSRDINITKNSDTHLSGVVNAEEDGQRLLLTIPYDKGWTLTVDGKKTTIDKTADVFMSAELSKGEHTYELKFFPEGLKEGIIISLVSVMSMIGFMLVLSKKRKNNKNTE